MNRTDLEAIAKVIEEKDLFVLSDEIYSELTYSGKHVSIAEISGMRDRTVLINGIFQGICDDRVASRLCGGSASLS